MRPPQLILLLLCLILFPLFFTTLSLRSAHRRQGPAVGSTTYATTKAGRLRALFSFHAPASLFPPSAVISLTDDNSTFFLARPAAFGPVLPSTGLKGQLWIGSGFGDDAGRKIGVTSGLEGELGCSDVPGWEDGNVDHSSNGLGSSHGFEKLKTSKIQEKPIVDDKAPDKNHHKRNSDNKNKADKRKSPNDGTDDHLHTFFGGSGSPALKEKTRDPIHADIQSLQESAEITGKIVLLSRGGCGFLEKVKWVQRRGGVALVVGDNTRGGGLVTMYARGDTSNVTIPAIFTSHTSAHLLSSLIPPERSQESNAYGGHGKETQNKKRPGDSTVPIIPVISSSSKSSTGSNNHEPATSKHGLFHWISSLVGAWRTKSPSPDESRRPPSSGNIDWASQEDTYHSTPDRNPGRKEKINTPPPSKATPVPHPENEDDFVIGVQDWRDPDLVRVRTTPTSTSTPSPKSPEPKSWSGKSGKQSDTGSGIGRNDLKGGSITPGSGEYISQDKPSKGKGGSTASDPNDPKSNSASSDKKSSWWKAHFSWGEKHSNNEAGFSDQDNKPSKGSNTGDDGSITGQTAQIADKDGVHHDGLWVTLTPANMSTSPFFDTLLVLVVSPLVTLTVVYALLLLRSRIRRRRWRAPKAIVDRLPVRTYHTMPSGSSSSTPPRTAVTDTPSPSSPLLPRSEHGPSSSGSSQLTGPVTASSNSVGPQAKRSSYGTEKPNGGSTLWRRKYTGRQVECVVCLEEYIDGESKVMSLPCGHEFHAECITPWLTTRRRTCPICKGDVVRSIGQRRSNEDHYGSPNPTSDTAQSQIAETRNDSPSSAIPIAPNEDIESDLEHGALLGSPASQHSPSSWRNLASLSLSALSGDSIWHQARHTRTDRNR
ncbi:hypothetical protein FQN57_001713 [Myotisia sp. PD_48]|nr:hypothetical protein FQN57_001713 [Myotisia sp. PD_48]